MIGAVLKNWPAGGKLTGHYFVSYKFYEPIRKLHQFDVLSVCRLGEEKEIISIEITILFLLRKLEFYFSWGVGGGSARWARSHRSQQKGFVAAH